MNTQQLRLYKILERLDQIRLWAADPNNQAVITTAGSDQEIVIHDWLDPVNGGAFTQVYLAFEQEFGSSVEYQEFPK